MSNIARIQEDNTRKQERMIENVIKHRIHEGTKKCWGDRYKSLTAALESANPSIRRRAMTTFQVMENQQRMLDSIKADPIMEATFTANLGQLVPKIIDLVRIFYPNLIAQELVDIQPQDRQNGEIFIVKPVYSNSAGGVNAGDQIFKNITDGTYASEFNSLALAPAADGIVVAFTGTFARLPIRPGTVRITSGAVSGIDDGAGAISGTGITGTINYTTGAVAVTFTVAPILAAQPSAVGSTDLETNPAGIRQVEIQLLTVPIQAKPHPLNIKYSSQAQLAAAAHLNLDIPDVLTNLVGSFIKQERDVTLINTILSKATLDTLLDFDATPPSNYSKLAKYAEIQTKLNYAESKIQQTQGRGGVSWVLAGNNAADVWRNAAGFQPIAVNAPIGPHKIGTLRDGTVSVIKVPFMDSNTYCVGFKGYVVGDSATILAEWIPLYATPVFQSPDLNNYQGMMSLYDLFVNNAGYYRFGRISNYSA